MAYGFRPIFRANLYVVWFVYDCVLVKYRFHRVLGLFETKHCVSGQQNLEHNGKWGCAQISAHSCESTASTLDGHNFLVRTPIRAFLDSTESSSSLEFNKIKCSAKCRLNIGLGQGKLRNSPFWFPELLFSEPVCNRNAWDCI